MKSTLVRSVFLSCVLVAIPDATSAGDPGGGRTTTSTGRHGNGRHGPTVELLGSPDQRDFDPNATSREIETLVAGHTAFALDVYSNIRDGDGNIFFSPYSISTALGMIHAGSRGETARRIADTLHFGLTADRLHTAINSLDLELAGRGVGVEGDPPELVVANSLWGQRGFPLQEEFLRVLATHYGAGMRLVDFIAAPNQVGQLINDWIAERTDGQIDELIQQGDITRFTRFVVTNAIFFRASWWAPFPVNWTSDRDFQRLDGGIVRVPTMRTTLGIGYSRGKGYEAIELLYTGEDLSMVVIAPDLGGFTRFENQLTPRRLQHILATLRGHRIDLLFPKFDFEYPLDLKDTLVDLGLGVAFASSADFSGISTNGELRLTDVLHQAFVAVDERGTSAGAATAAIGGADSEPMRVEINRPFIFLIRDRPTGAVLFLGRVIDPSGN